MRPRTEISAVQAGAIHRAMLEAPNKSAFQRLQCLWLRASQELSTEAIAQAVGLSVSHVRRVWSEYLRGGLAAGQGRPKGGRRHQNLTVAQEQAVLAPWRGQARRGGLVNGSRHQSGLRATLGTRGARFDGLSPAGAPSVASGDSAPQASQRQPGGPCRF